MSHRNNEFNLESLIKKSDKDNQSDKNNKNKSSKSNNSEKLETIPLQLGNKAKQLQEKRQEYGNHLNYRESKQQLEAVNKNQQDDEAVLDGLKDTAKIFKELAKQAENAYSDFQQKEQELENAKKSQDKADTILTKAKKNFKDAYSGLTKITDKLTKIISGDSGATSSTFKTFKEKIEQVLKDIKQQNLEKTQNNFAGVEQIFKRALHFIKVYDALKDISQQQSENKNQKETLQANLKTLEAERDSINSKISQDSKNIISDDEYNRIKQRKNKNSNSHDKLSNEEAIQIIEQSKQGNDDQSIDIIRTENNEIKNTDLQPIINQIGELTGKSIQKDDHVDHLESSALAIKNLKTFLDSKKSEYSKYEKKIIRDVDNMLQVYYKDEYDSTQAPPPKNAGPLYQIFRSKEPKQRKQQETFHSRESESNSTNDKYSDITEINKKIFEIGNNYNIIKNDIEKSIKILKEYSIVNDLSDEIHHKFLDSNESLQQFYEVL